MYENVYDVYVYVYENLYVYVRVCVSHSYKEIENS